MIFPFLLCQSTTSYLMNCSYDTVSVQDCNYTSAKQTHFNHLFNSWRANTLSLQLQQAFTVKQYLASHSYITCKNEFWDEFSNYHMPHNSSVLSGEVTAWHKQRAGQKMFLSSLGVLWQFGQYLSHFVTLSKKTDEITWSLDLDIIWMCTTHYKDFKLHPHHTQVMHTSSEWGIDILDKNFLY